MIKWDEFIDKAKGNQTDKSGTPVNASNSDANAKAQTPGTGTDAAAKENRMEELIRKVITTLNLVEVKGKGNIDRLLGCILALEKVADAMKHNREEMGKTMPEERSEENGDV